MDFQDLAGLKWGFGEAKWGKEWCDVDPSELVFSERELKLSSAVRLSSVCLSSVTFVRPTQTIEIFGNVFTPRGTLAIHDLCVKILRRSSQRNPSVGGVKHKRGSRI